MRCGRCTLLACAVVTLVALSALIGCTQLQTHDTLASLFTGRQDLGVVPREADGRLPPYIIEAPDVLLIEVIVKDPKAGTTGRLPDQAIAGQFVVRTDGTVDLGVWGSVPVVGLTMDQVDEAVRKQLAKFPDKVATDKLVVTVDVVAYNSKRYYVITEAPNKVQQVAAFPLTGAETVLDAIAAVDGLAEVANKSSIRVVRKRADGTEESLPVDWSAISRHGVVKTNYPFQSGDRLYVTTQK